MDIEGSTYTPKTRDRVRVILEGEVTPFRNGGFLLGPELDANLITPGASHVVSIEKLRGPEPVWTHGTVARYSHETSPIVFDGTTQEWRWPSGQVTRIFGRFWAKGDVAVLYTPEGEDD